MNTRVSHWIRTICLALLIAAVGLALIKKHITVSSSGEFAVSSDVLAFVKAGNDLLHGNNIYYTDAGGKTSYVYPPFYAFVNIPLTLISPIAVDVAWYLLNIYLLGLLFLYSYEIFTGSSFSSFAIKQQWIIVSASILLSLRYLVRNAQDANINIVILFLIVFSIYKLRKSKQSSWALLIGIAAAIKILPLIFIIYFVARREWKASGYLLAGFVVATFLPSILIGIDKNLEYLNTFLDYSRSQFSPQGLEIENFSFWGTLGRLLSHSKSFDYPDGTPVYINLSNFGLQSLRYGLYCIDIVIMTVLYAFIRKEKTLASSSNDNITNASLPLTLLCMNFLSILTEDHHTVTFLLIYFYLLIWWKGNQQEKRSLLWIIITTGLASILISYDVIVPLFGKNSYMMLLSYSLPVLPVGILLTVLVMTTFRIRSSAPKASRTS